MARIFSLNFEFQHHLHTALVTACTGKDGHLKYTVSLHDEPFQRLLPNGRISFHNLAELRPMAEAQPRLHELILSLASALHEKLCAASKTA